VRAVLWAMALDHVPPASHLQLLAQQLPRESSPTLVAAALDRTLNDLVRRVLPPSDVPAALEVVATACSLETLAVCIQAAVVVTLKAWELLDVRSQAPY